MRLPNLIAAIALAASSLNPLAAQNYIGLHKTEINMRVRQELPSFRFDNEVNNKNRSFIKFVDDLDEQTILFVLDSTGVCTAVSRMYNTWLYDDVYKSLNHKYLSVGTNLWVEERGGQKFLIQLKRGKWYITVSIKPDAVGTKPLPLK